MKPHELKKRKKKAGCVDTVKLVDIEFGNIYLEVQYYFYFLIILTPTLFDRRIFRV